MGALRDGRTTEQWWTMQRVQQGECGHISRHSYQQQPTPATRLPLTLPLPVRSVGRLLGLCRVTRLMRVLDSKLESSNVLLLEYSHRIFITIEISK